ncbi:uncharacterized protein LACBIDRAFT_334084 [Laccaria bicolor S238N-H82]|uniref:Predicted protein n=1 Tax=Laccaria bicolor (strain S238N-H82 / ATCC MYA-4686) TaxID=486041 RepID=B0DY14_LACBS|nr:uncharacterized protein LACBIDRAFT_334084 [Laccaria bicolor S238N-H82]EDR00606.1 predicted protein [Laccaria bicolor S238N-H82]|eukprot:XP_001888833.1 predicted protein [Laccaria bicolor S238N-H82]
MTETELHLVETQVKYGFGNKRGYKAPANSNSETEPDSGAEDLTAIVKLIMPASDSAMEPDSGAQDLVPKPDFNPSSSKDQTGPQKTAVCGLFAVYRPVSVCIGFNRFMTASKRAQERQIPLGIGTFIK